MSRQTALITGASSGIGEAFARQLAAEQFNLILVARRKDRLTALAEEIQAGKEITVEILVADLATENGIAAVEKKIAGEAVIDLLINNAGFGTTGAFHDVEEAKQNRMITLHVDASVRLSRVALPGMIERKSGGIINLSSISSFSPTPNRTLYGATKAFLNQFSSSLHAEVSRFGVHVQALAPGFTYTEFHDSPEFAGWSRSQVSKKLWMNANEVAAISLKELRRGKRPIVIPGWRNRMFVWLNTSALTAPIMTSLMAKRLNDPHRKS